MILNTLAFLVLVMLTALVVLAIVKLGCWPKKAAVERNNPYADTINVLSWGGLVLTAGVGWLIALAWAYAPASVGESDLLARVEKLEAELAARKA